MKKYVKGCTGYNLFCSTVKVQDISRYGQMWNNLSDDKKKNWKQKADAYYNDGNLENLSDKQKKIWRSKYLKQLDYTCNILEKLGITTAGYAVCDDRISAFGTEKGKQIFAKLDSQQKGMPSMSKAMLQLAKHPSENLKVLQKKVQAIFNEKYSIALGKKRSLSYKNCDVSFVVNGLPEGVKVKKPHSYGILTCRRIISGKDAISVHFLGEKPHKFDENSTMNDNSSHPEETMFPGSEPNLNVNKEIEVQITEFPDPIFQLVTPSPNQHHIDKEEQKMVKDIFNEKYSLALGKKRCVSYINFNSTFVVNGLPDGIPFKKPHFYGKKTCHQIISAKDDITFHFLNKSDSNLKIINSIPETVSSQKGVSVMPALTSIVKGPDSAKKSGPQVKTNPQDTLSSCHRFSRKRVWKTVAIPSPSKKILQNPPSNPPTTDQPSSSGTPPSGESVSEILALLEGRLRLVESQLAANNASESDSVSANALLSLFNAQRGKT